MKSLLPQWCTPLSIQACASGSGDLSTDPIDAIWLNRAASQGGGEIRCVQIGRACLRGQQQCYLYHHRKAHAVFIADTVPERVGCRTRRTKDVERVTAFRPPIGSFCCTKFIARNSVHLYIKSFHKVEWISTPVGTHTLEHRTCTQKDNVQYAFNLNGPLCSKPSISNKFLVCSQGGNSGRRNWLNRILFEPFKPEDFPVWDDETDLDEADQGSGDDKLDDDDDDDDDSEEDEIDRMLKDDASFEAWKRRAEARTELQENQKLGRDPDNTDWEDWLDDSWAGNSTYTGVQDNGWYTSESDWEKDGVPRPPPKLPERGMGRSMKEFLFRIFEPEDEVKDELVFEEKVFRYTSQTTAKFVAMLVAVPWLVGYLSHDFLIVPFLNRYVETVPLAAQILDVRESQKLQMIEKLKLERQRVRFEAAIGKAPPLSQDELREHIREEALEMREELRLENRKAFANIWSDLLAGLTVFLLLFFNPRKVAIMRLTGTRLFTNISDTGKAFIIILLSDIFLGYHSESGWETIVEMFLEHYGFEVDQGAIYIFVAIVPVTIDACFKLWVFRFLTRLSPSAAATFREMKRH